MKTIRWIIIFIIVIAVAGVVVWWHMSPEVSRVTMHKAEIKDVKAMAQLCTVDITEDVPIKGSVGPRHIFARQTVNGTISFDLDNLTMEEVGDSAINVTLPPEIVEIYESTEPNSYVVIDQWTDDFFGSPNLTTAQENAIKSKVRDNFRKKIYAKGYVKRARAEAVENLTSMLGAMTGKRVTVTDPSPAGYPR